MNRVRVLAPLAGWALPLSEVCDEVFAAGMAGDGIAIDPTEGMLHAPCDGEIVLPGAAMHALTLRLDGGCDLLLHVGIDTIALRGEGFERLVAAGQRVLAGEPLLRFDLDLVARRARSTVTPVLVASGARVLSRVTGRSVAIGEPLLEIEPSVVAAMQPQHATERLARFRVPFDHGLHARPAAQLVALLRPFASDVTMRAHARSANARSAVSLMGLGVHAGDEVQVSARGADAEAVLEALAALLVPVREPRLPPAATARTAAASVVPQLLSGAIASRGLAAGRALRLDQPDIPIDAQGRGEAVERQALQHALAAVAQHLGVLSLVQQGAQREVLEAHLALLDDPELGRVADAAVARGASAGLAWREASRASAASLRSLGDARMAERAADLRDIENQVLRVLAGEAPSAGRNLPEDTILLTDELLPSQLAALDLARVAGICMAHGGPTSHAALLAAARGIPTLVALGDALLTVTDGSNLLLDAERGELHIGPSATEVAALRQQIAQHASREARELASATLAGRTADGVAVAVVANIGAVAEAASAVTRGAEGCGLLRTEFLFLDRRAAPDEDEQARVYAAVAAGFGTMPVTIRTLDVGGDKPLAYLPLTREENPALGIRGVRVGLRQPDLLCIQLRALLCAAGGAAGALRIMLPMVNDLAELRAARALLEQCRREGGIASAPALGVMIETPAAAMLADQLAREADFLSIGSNDLSQYVLAMDRGHSELAAQLDGLHPAVLRLIERVARAGQRAGCSVSVCGGMASDPDAVPVLVGLGIRELSVVPASIPRIKRILRELDVAACETLAKTALECTSAQEVRLHVARFTAAGNASDAVEVGESTRSAR